MVFNHFNVFFWGEVMISNENLMKTEKRREENKPEKVLSSYGEENSVGVSKIR